MMDKGGLVVFCRFSSSSKKSSNNVAIKREKRRARHRRVIFLTIINFHHRHLKKIVINLTTSKFKIWVTYLDSESSNTSSSNAICSSNPSCRVSNFKNKSPSHPKESNFNFQDLILRIILSRILND